MKTIKQRLRKIFREKLTEVYFDSYDKYLKLEPTSLEESYIDDMVEEFIEVIEKHLGVIIK